MRHYYRPPFALRQHQNEQDDDDVVNYIGQIQAEPEQ